ncbi:hypothetical protein G6F57_018039 [Rhizopus arrhizus]|nr:hypothetical protein G6F57_018039 [Rhizopus arrhizus]
MAWRAFNDGIACGGGFAQARAHGQHQIGVAQALAQRGRHGPAHVAGGVGVALVKAFQAAPGGAHRQFEALGETGDLVDGGLMPAVAAQQQERPFGRIQQLRHAGQVGGAGVAVHARIARQVRHAGGAPQRVFRQRQHDRAGAAAGGNRERAREVFGDAVGAVDLCDPLGHLAEHAAVVDFLEGFTLHEVIAHLAHEQDHRRGGLVGGVHADAGVGGARAARHEADAGLAGQLAVGIGHHGRAAFLTADGDLDVSKTCLTPWATSWSTRM